jgi:hypothetical protein
MIAGRAFPGLGIGTEHQLSGADQLGRMRPVEPCRVKDCREFRADLSFENVCLLVCKQVEATRPFGRIDHPEISPTV